MRIERSWWSKEDQEERQREKEEKQQQQAEARQRKLLEREQRAQEAERQQQEQEQAKRAKTELQRAQKEQKQHAQKEQSKLKALKKEQRMKYVSRANCFPSCLAGGRPRCICGRARFPPDYIVVGPSPADEEGIPHQVAQAFEANELKFGVAPTPHMRKLLMKSNEGRQILQDIATYGEYGKFHNYPESDEEIESCDESCDESAYSGSDSGSDSECVMYSDDSSGSNTFNIFIF